MDIVRVEQSKALIRVEQIVVTLLSTSYWSRLQRSTITMLQGGVQ